ncbi:MAG TPA: hypothetical protein VF841_17570, partial [Anaeromyxobacter sp.]
MLLPFHEKAFTVDDTTFLFEARHALEDPLHPSAFDMVWTEVPERVSLMSGPVMAWLLMPAVAAGGSEWVAHATVLGMLAVALFATVALALRLQASPRAAMYAGLLVAAAPAVLGMAGTAMADVPAMALGVLGLERSVAWRDGRRAHQAIAAAVLLALAALTRSHLVLLLPIAALLVAGEFPGREAWRRSSWRAFVPIGAAPVIAGAILYVIRDPQPGAAGIAAAPALLSEAANILPNGVAFLVHWTLVLPLALPWAVLRPRPVFRRWWLVGLGAIGAGALMVTRRLGPLWVAPLAGLSVAVLWDVSADALKRRDYVQLALACWLFAPLAPAPYSHLPPKYMLAAAPAVAILVARAAIDRAAPRARLAIVGAAVAGLALGIAILRADAAFAGLGRR